MRFEARLSGSGGQGMILAGIILAEAAILDGNNAVQTQSYGPEARGGASRSEVIIADELIDFPKVTEPDLILAMSREAVRKYVTGASGSARIIVDSSVVEPDAIAGREIVSVPITEVSVRVTGRAVAANVVAVGVIGAITGIVSSKRLEEAVLRHVPARTRESNVKALRAGLELGLGAIPAPARV